MNGHGNCSCCHNDKVKVTFTRGYDLSERTRPPHTFYFFAFQNGVVVGSFNSATQLITAIQPKLVLGFGNGTLDLNWFQRNELDTVALVDVGTPDMRVAAIKTMLEKARETKYFGNRPNFALVIDDIEYKVVQWRT